MEADQLEICSDSQLVVKQIENSYGAKGKKNDHLPQKGARAASKVYMGSGHTCPKDREHAGGRLNKASDNPTGGFKQIDTGRAPPRTLGEHQLLAALYSPRRAGRMTVIAIVEVDPQGMVHWSIPLVRVPALRVDSIVVRLNWFP